MPNHKWRKKNIFLASPMKGISNSVFRRLDILSYEVFSPARSLGQCPGPNCKSERFKSDLMEASGILWKAGPCHSKKGQKRASEAGFLTDVAAIGFL